MKVVPVPHEPTRYMVTSETDGEPWLVDLDHEGRPFCACAIIHNRTDAHALCKHIRHVQRIQQLLKMKALSIRQPWAWLIVNGFKPVENRTWHTNVRGDIQIHASAGMTQQEYADAVAFAKRANPAVRIPAFEELKRGGIVGIATIVDCVNASPSPWFVGPYGFVLQNPYPLPFRPCKGAIGFFDPV